MKEDLKLYIEKIEPDVKIPVKLDPTSSGFDLYANSIKRIYVHAGGNGERILQDEHMRGRLQHGELSLNYLERVLIGTGIKATVGPGYELQIRPRSGLALKQGLSIVNTPGTIDEGYRDEIGVILINLSRATQIIKSGTRIAQLVVCPVALPVIEEVDQLPKSDLSNRDGGYGSTGVS